MKTFEIYIKENADGLPVDVESVKTGFNFYAFIFSSFWALYHRIWPLFFGLITIDILFFYLIYKSPESAFLCRFLSLIINILIGFEASNFRGKQLIKNNYKLADISIANNNISAEQRFLDRFSFPATI